VINDYYSLFVKDAALNPNQIPADGAPFTCNQEVLLDFYSLADANDPELVTTFGEIQKEAA